MLLFSLFWPATGVAQKPAAPALSFNRLSPAASTVPSRAALASLKILALRVAFEEDSNLSTTGNGSFLMSLESLSVGSVPCDGDAFLVDPPPHNSAYFQSQLQALANYFSAVTGDNIAIDMTASQVFPAVGAPLMVGPMASYTSSSGADDSTAALIVPFLEQSLAAAENAGAQPQDYDLVIIFHAGLGQDFNYPILDPTPRDLPSTFVDGDMIKQATGSSVLILPSGAEFSRPALIVPEGQNHIFYDIALDIFGQTDLCDVQIGLTGTLALLVGYALGLPPLFDTEAGETAVGQFGLMDVGSGNGQGVIPAPPSAWMRTYMGWETAGELLGSSSLTARHLPGAQIGKVTLGNTEYLLVENRLNWILPGVDMDSLRFRNAVLQENGSYDLPNYFDYLVDSAEATVDAETNVILSVPNYDIGLPGSGLLIWHIDESRYNTGMSGINNDRDRRAVSLVEADGAIDIGFPTTALFADPSVGWRWDLWYAGNPAWIDANPKLQLGPGAPLMLTATSNPPLILASGGSTGIEILDIGAAGSVLTFTVSDAASVTRLPEGARLLGFNGEDYLWRLADSVWLGAVKIDIEVAGATIAISEHDAPLKPGSGIWLIDNVPDSYTAYRLDPSGKIDYQKSGDGIIIAPNPKEYPYYNDGILHITIMDAAPTPDSTRIHHHAPVPDSGFVYPSLADLDGDGGEEWLSYSGESPARQLTAYSADWQHSASSDVWSSVYADSLGLLVMDGFPVEGDFTSYLLVANLMGDILPEIVAVESGEIVLLSHDGVELSRLGLHSLFSNRFLMHLSDGRVGLANGDRIHWFTPDEQNPQWVTRHGSHSRGYRSRNDRIADRPQPAVLDKSRVYNYPNPVTGGRTTIRFYVGAGSSATIRIYTIDGHTVAKVELSALWQNNYNEWVWQVGQNPGGLYYGLVEVKGATEESTLIKIAVVR
ncbi:MAG: hypothetical protein IIA59_00250 [Candidatus Marinimicrobia bacterium]|nr:hypothetical protein [Candidatus Neomarinimicrobiota bacterium]